MALLRILFLFLVFIPLQTFADATAGVEAAEPTIPLAQKVSAEATKFGVHTAEVQNAAQKLQASSASCDGKKVIADNVCLETKNVNVLSFVAENGDLVNMGLMIGSSIGEQCKGISDMLQKAGTVLGLYQAACKTAQVVCNASCTKAAADSKLVKAAVKEAIAGIATEKRFLCGAAAAGNPQPCTDKTAEYTTALQGEAGIDAVLPKFDTATEKKNVVCTKYQISTQQAMMGALNALKSYAQAKQCEKQNTSNPVMANQDCGTKEAAGYNTPNCQCARGEKSAAECQNINVQASNLRPGAIAIPNTGNLKPTDKKGLGGMDLGGDKGDLGPKNAASAGAGAPVQGGGGGAAGGGGGQGGLGQDGAGSGRRLNANVLGGGFGGGGGGSGGGGPGYGVDEKLKDYMPGGKNDPNRTIASQIAKEVTPQAGRSNWEKVKLRYRDNYSSLLNK